MTEHTLPQPLVTTDWVAERLADPTIKLLDGTCFLPTDGRNAGAEFEVEHLRERYFSMSIRSVSRTPGCRIPGQVPSVLQLLSDNWASVTRIP